MTHLSVLQCMPSLSEGCALAGGTILLSQALQCSLCWARLGQS